MKIVAATMIIVVNVDVTVVRVVAVIVTRAGPVNVILVLDENYA